MKGVKPKASTKTKLLDAAIELFADKGFVNTTVAEICHHAEANIAAINYHFNNKEELYKKAWQYAFENSMKKDTLIVDEKLKSHEALRRHISFLITHISDPDNKSFDMFEHEFTNPTGLLHDIVSQSLKPYQEYSFKIISDLLGETSAPQAIALCHSSIIAQSFHLRKMLRFQKQGSVSDFPKIDLSSYIEHVYNFSLGGINNIKSGLTHD